MKDKKQTLVPQLRFPEFQDAGEWALSNLGKLFENRQEAGFESLPLLSLTDKDGIIPQEESNRKNNASADKSRYLRVVPGDIAYNTMRMWEGRSAYVDREGIISPAYTVCKPKGSVNGLFYSYYFKTNQLIEQFRRYSQGLVKDTLNLKYAAFSQIPALVPKSKEQQKIADCLSALDALIAAQADKINALKIHKKWLMQQLFPREGETVPRLRFPEFRDKGEWEESGLGRCLEKVIDYRGKPPPKAESGVPLITAKNVRAGRLDMTVDEYIEADAYDSWMTKGIPKIGDILFTTEAPLGNVAMFPGEGKFALGQRIITLRCKTKKCVAEFLFQSLLGPEMQEKIDFHSTGSTAKGIKSSVFVTLRLRYPQLEEQRHIASCLSSLDSIIIAETHKLEALKTHKKGLMQQLFPSTEAIDV